jgi:hypothetical protein
VNGPQDARDPNFARPSGSGRARFPLASNDPPSGRSSSTVPSGSDISISSPRSRFAILIHYVRKIRFRGERDGQAHGDDVCNHLRCVRVRLGVRRLARPLTPGAAPNADRRGPARHRMTALHFNPRAAEFEITSCAVRAASRRTPPDSRRAPSTHSISSPTRRTTHDPAALPPGFARTDSGPWEFVAIETTACAWVV